jgi:hypothetical protein
MPFLCGFRRVFQINIAPILFCMQQHLAILVFQKSGEALLFLLVDYHRVYCMLFYTSKNV